MERNASFLFHRALLPGGWADDVRVSVDGNGLIESVEPGVDNGSEDPVTIRATVIPAMPNCHSHAHQRAMAGLGERATIDRDSGGKLADSFWTWRTVMYHYLARIRPGDLYAIASQLYLEMLKAGYTHIAEFQYLHHDVDGSPYGNRAEMTLQCLQAARDVGIGFTALPVLYRYGGFGQQPGNDGQKRFFNDADAFCEIVDALFAERTAGISAHYAIGIAPHSLRAVSKPLMDNVLDGLQSRDLAAIHVHVAEQVREVEDCVAWSGQRPVEWMLENFAVDSHWCAIHATHMTSGETRDLARSGAIAGLCPTTEANLGDGLFNFTEFVEHGGRWAIGSDSHISIDPVEELRWLEYGLRLQGRSRNVVATVQHVNTGAKLFGEALEGGRQSSGLPLGRIEAGSRCDFLVLDDQHPRLYGRSGDDMLDSLVFSGNQCLVQDVYVGGERVIDAGRHVNENAVQEAYKRTLDRLAGA